MWCEPLVESCEPRALFRVSNASQNTLSRFGAASFDLQRLQLAVEIHSKSYQFLKWMGKQIDQGKIPLDRVTSHEESPQAAVQWIEANFDLIPLALRPAKEHLREFAQFFWTYVVTSFEVVEQPGLLRLPGRCGCSCSFCCRMVSASHLRPRKLVRSDRMRAVELMEDQWRRLAHEVQRPPPSLALQHLLSTPSARRDLAYLTYCHWLVERMEGRTEGPAILALWREIAYLPTGSPIQGFTVRVEDFVAARGRLSGCLLLESG